MDTGPRRQIDSWRAAEENAAAWMRHWGYRDAEVTPGGPDSGIDIRASTALAQVKWEAAQTGAPALQRLVGARRRDHRKELLFFAGAGYSAPAVAYADDMDVALFKYSLDGDITAVNRAARRVAARTANFDPEIGVAVPTHLQPGWQREHAAVRAMKSPEGSWLRSNWAGLLGAFFLLQALRNGVNVIRGEAGSGIDWYDPLLSLLIGLVFTAIWAATGNRRQRWKGLRRNEAARLLPVMFRRDR